MNSIHPLMADALSTVTPSNPRAVIGGNAPPPKILEQIFDEINRDLPDDLARECAHLVERTGELVASVKTIPATIENDDEDRQAADIIGQAKEHRAVLESRRMGINAGARQAKDIIDGFFKVGGTDDIDAAIEAVKPAITAYKRRKVEEEKRRREEAERLAREEAERQRAAAAEALRKQREAEEERRRSEAAAKAAQEAAERAKREAAEAEARRQQAERDRAAAEQRARLARDEEERQRAAQAVADAQRRADEEAAAKRRADEEARLERERAAAAKTELSLAKADLADASKDAKTATSLAKQAEGDARKAEKAVNAKASTMSGNRGEYGGQSGLTTRWVGDIIDTDKLDPTVLWPFVKEAARKEAVDAFVKINKGTRKLRGVHIYETTDTAFR